MNNFHDANVGETAMREDCDIRRKDAYRSKTSVECEGFRGLSRLLHDE